MQTGPAECMEFVGEHEDEDCTNDVDSTSNKTGILLSVLEMLPAKRCFLRQKKSDFKPTTMDLSSRKLQDRQPFSKLVRKWNT